MSEIGHLNTEGAKIDRPGFLRHQWTSLTKSC